MILDFGDTKAEWTEKFPEEEDLEEFIKDPTIKVKAIGSKHDSGYKPLSGIRLYFSNDD